MAIPNIPSYTGQKPDPSQPQSEFNQNVSDELDYFNDLPENLNPAIDEMNNTAAQVTADKDAAETSATAAETSATAAQGYSNFQGPWSAATGAWGKGNSFDHNGRTWALLVDLADITTVEPGSDDLKWRVQEVSKNINLLSNHNFLIPSPDDITHPSATPTDYTAGTQIFSGVFVGSDVVGLTYINGRVKWTNATGAIYFSVANSNGLEYVTEFTASVADFDGNPRTRGVSFALVGDEYRVTVDADALEDVAANPTPLGSVKFEQGSVATGHETESLSSLNLSDYTDIVYKASGGNSAVENMIAGIPVAVSVGQTCQCENGTRFKRISGISGSISDFNPASTTYLKDFVVGDFIADDADAFEMAVNIAIADGFNVDFSNCECLLKREISFNLSNTEIVIKGTNSKIAYEPASHTRDFITFNLIESDITIEKGVTFDSQQNSNVTVYINSTDDVEVTNECSNVYFYGTVRNAYRIIDFVRGAGLHITGGFSNVLFDGEAYNCRAENGAIITGSQAIRGVLIGSLTGGQYPISVVIGDNSVIEGVGSDDLSITNDQDGLYVATPISANVDTTLVISEGATFKSCRGRCVKAKVDNAVVGGLYIVNDGNNVNEVQSVIDLQYGGVYKNCIVRIYGITVGTIFGSGGLEYSSTERSTESSIKDCYIWSDVPVPVVANSFPRGGYVGDINIRDVFVRAEVETFFVAFVNGMDRTDSISDVIIDNLTGELVSCRASGGDSPYAGSFDIKGCVNKTPTSLPLVIRSGISGVSADGWANAENMAGFAPSKRAFRRLSGAGEEVPYGKSMSPILAQRIDSDGSIDHTGDSGAFFGETVVLAEDVENTFTGRGRSTSAQGIYFLSISNINGNDYLDIVAVAGVTITSLSGGLVGDAYEYGSGSDPAVANKINVWIDSTTGSMKVKSRQGGTSRVLTVYSMS